MNHEPEDFARALLRHFDIERAEDVASLAKQLRLAIREVDSTGFEGALVRIPQNRGGIIALRKDFREAGRRRFTIAHEVGHFVLPGHGQDACFCTTAQIESWRKDAVRKQEYEANRFASEFLLPGRVLYPLVNASDLTLAKIRQIAEQFDTSLTATAVKCVEVSEEACAVVLSVGRRVKWVSKSESFNYFVPNMILTNDSLAGRLFEAEDLKKLEGSVAASSWIDYDQLDRGKELWEESISMPYYDSVLTILTI